MRIYIRIYIYICNIDRLTVRASAVRFAARAFFNRFQQLPDELFILRSLKKAIVSLLCCSEPCRPGIRVIRLIPIPPPLQPRAINEPLFRELSDSPQQVASYQRNFKHLYEKRRYLLAAFSRISKTDDVIPRNSGSLTLFYLSRRAGISINCTARGISELDLILRLLERVVYILVWPLLFRLVIKSWLLS